MLFVKRETENISDEQIKMLAQKYDISETIARLIYSRGVRDFEGFLHPNLQNLNDPFLLSGMAETVSRLRMALENGETVVIYGDYDTDGVSASAILYLYLKSIGLQNIHCYLPNRYVDGYGLTMSAIEKIAEDYMPDLIITVDCGISCKAEIDYIHELGIDVIVTDHHDIPLQLPDCITINAKLPNQAYPFKQLCGAGVALKIVQAMGGMQAINEYIDIAAIATVADIVPLLDENRIIVHFGLEAIKKHKRIGIKMLMKDLKITNELTATDISFKLAPKINAAGRMGDSTPSLLIFISKDEADIKQSIIELTAHNTKRQELCNLIYTQCISEIVAGSMADCRAIVLSSNEWDSGILGIVAARLTDEFNRPVFLFSQTGDSLKGSCRSINGVNIYEMLSSFKDILETFGGHTMAAGLTLKVKNYDKFVQSVDDYVSKNYGNGLFMPSKIYDDLINIKDIDMDFVTKLDILEPFGCENPRPIFCIEFEKANVSLMRNYNNHLIVQAEGFSMVYFNASKYYFTLSSDCKKTALIELQTDIYRDKQTVKGVIRALDYSSVLPLEQSKEIAYGEYIKQLLYTTNSTEAKYKQYTDTQNLVNGLIKDNLCGTLFIANTVATFEKFILNNWSNQIIYKDMFYFTASNGFNTLILSPATNSELAIFKNIVLLDPVLDDGYIKELNKFTVAQIYAPADRKFDSGIFKNANIMRDKFEKYFYFINRGIKNNIFGINEYDWFNKACVGLNEQLNYVQFVICLYTFKELGIYKIKTEGVYSLGKCENVNSRLENSNLFNILQFLTKVI
ncbi:MAG: single-stranded-DNA-specific exonuclease RecJ [Clostridia bacterium]|nr:single-stranded-DNA-specific exonuclease RecJ [Clostridia bacterium]